MWILLWILFGGIVGWIASLIMNTEPEQGVILNVIIGVIGALIGGWIMSFFGESGVSGFNLYSFMVALLGAVILITLARFVQAV